MNSQGWFTEVADELKELAIKSKDRMQARGFVPVVRKIFLDKKVKKIEYLKDLFLFLLNEVDKKCKKKNPEKWENIYVKGLVNFMGTTMLLAVEEFNDPQQIELNHLLQEIKKISSEGYCILTDIKNKLFTTQQAFLKYKDEMEMKGIRRLKDKTLISAKAQRKAIEEEIPLAEAIQTEIEKHITSQGKSLLHLLEVYDRVSKDSKLDLYLPNILYVTNFFIKGLCRMADDRLKLENNSIEKKEIHNFIKESFKMGYVFQYHLSNCQKYFNKDISDSRSYEVVKKLRKIYHSANETKDIKVIAGHLTGKYSDLEEIVDLLLETIKTALKEREIFLDNEHISIALSIIMIIFFIGFDLRDHLSLSFEEV